MKNLIPVKEYILDMLRCNRFAVLATVSDDQPYASLIAVTAVEGYIKLIFATYRNTRKYNNLIRNGNVSILFENRSTTNTNLPERTVLTALGQAEEMNISNSEVEMQSHLQRHPELESFLLSTDCALFQVKVTAYQVVRGIEDACWWTIEELDVLC